MIPLVNLFVMLWLLFAKGTAGANDHGPAPAPNTKTEVLLAWIVPATGIILGIVFATQIAAMSEAFMPVPTESSADTQL